MNWRYPLGLALLALALLTVLAGIGILIFGPADAKSAEWVVLMAAGGPEILCLLGAGVLGKENYQVLAPKIQRLFRRSERTAHVSRLRYYIGLAGCLLNGVPMLLYAYVPEMMPGGSTRMTLLLLADGVFIGSLFFAGGELWEKFRRIFIWEGDQSPIALN